MTHPLALHRPHWPKLSGPEPTGTPSERTREWLALLGHPERRLPPVVHVGGTKGKGSTIAFLRSMLEAAGYRAHVYTSPHLARFNERIVLAGHEISDTMLYQSLEAVRHATAGREVGFFDATTAAAILAFSQVPADILLMEMGLGGAVDATNCIDDPLLTIMTTLSYDHTEIMGTTLAEIARFEAGLFKSHIPCVVSYQAREAWEALAACSVFAGVPLYAYGRHWGAAMSDEGMRFRDLNGEVQLPLPSLAGAHQIVNAGTAIAALSALEGFDVPEAAIRAGLASARWKGRLERFTPKTLPPGAELWFDGGHNGAAAAAIAHHAAQNWTDAPLYVIMGTTRGKDLSSLIASFAAQAKRLYGVRVQSEPNSYEAADIVRAGLSLLPAETADNLHAALESIVTRESGPLRVLVFGSLYLWLETSLL
jgi:dihydrofolate synthase/folylpolyglutamate synthase